MMAPACSAAFDRRVGASVVNDENGLRSLREGIANDGGNDVLVHPGLDDSEQAKTGQDVRLEGIGFVASGAGGVDRRSVRGASPGPAPRPRRPHRTLTLNRPGRETAALRLGRSTTRRASLPIARERPPVRPVGTSAAHAPDVARALAGRCWRGCSEWCRRRPSAGCTRRPRSAADGRTRQSRRTHEGLCASNRLPTRQFDLGPREVLVAVLKMVCHEPIARFDEPVVAEARVCTVVAQQEVPVAIKPLQGMLPVSECARRPPRRREFVAQRLKVDGVEPRKVLGLVRRDMVDVVSTYHPVPPVQRAQVLTDRHALGALGKLVAVEVEPPDVLGARTKRLPSHHCVHERLHQASVEQIGLIDLRHGALLPPPLSTRWRPCCRCRR